MLLSRGATILKSASRITCTKPVPLQFKQTRNVWCYRTAPPPDKTWIFISELCGGLTWWWVLWNMWHEFDHLVGHFPYPRPYEWTDEELGIPPDDV